MYTQVCWLLIVYRSLRKVSFPPNFLLQVTVLRDGKQREMSVFDLLVGDVLFVGYGDILAVDGILIEGNSIRQMPLSFCEISNMPSCCSISLERRHPETMAEKAIDCKATHQRLAHLWWSSFSGGPFLESIGSEACVAF